MDTTHSSENDPENLNPTSAEEDITLLFENELKAYPQVYRFIQKLQEMVERQRKLLQKYHEKFKQLKKEIQHVGVQTNTNDILQQSMPTDDKGAIDIKSFKEEIVQAAHSAVQKSGFVYEPVSGLYYDYNTGYYYNSELGLYYDGNTSSYYYFNEQANKLEFHSQVQMPSSQQGSVSQDGDREDGELSSDDDVAMDTIPPHDTAAADIVATESKYRTPLEYYNSEEYRIWYESYVKSATVQYRKTPVSYNPSSEEAKSVNPALKTEEYEIANAWPPCLRIIVTETGVKGLKVGTLFLVTYLGGTVGREGEHAVLIPDINISKHHAKIAFTGTESNKEDPAKGYTLVDLGSRNGTYADGIRLSAALQESEPHLLKHGAELRIGSTKLSIHIHQGRDTCDQCEPGVLMGATNKPTPAKIDLSSNSDQNRQAELKRIRKKFGLDKNVTSKAKEKSGYEDRAERRRKTVGSLVEGEKTRVATMEDKISDENKGFKMLSKMGWKSGQTLGRDEANASALVEPIIPQQYAKNAGLGSSMSGPIATTSNPKEERKKTVWAKTQARYNILGDDLPTNNSPEGED